MKDEVMQVKRHVGEMLSGYIDGELTQQQRQRVELHCSECGQCGALMAELSALKDEIGRTPLGEYGEDTWREKMNDSTVQVTRGIGWILFLVGVMAIGGVVLYEFVIDSSIPLYVKLITGSIWGGLGILLLSVLRQRLIERKSDKYDDVEI
jgi:predicted anti-sigma-YlaC factor YlaD